jgi:hypothetical protein
LRFYVTFASLSPNSLNMQPAVAVNESLPVPSLEEDSPRMEVDRLRTEIRELEAEIDGYDAVKVRPTVNVNRGWGWFEWWPEEEAAIPKESRDVPICDVKVKLGVGTREKRRVGLGTKDCRVTFVAERWTTCSARVKFMYCWRTDPSIQDRIRRCRAMIAVHNAHITNTERELSRIQESNRTHDEEVARITTLVEDGLREIRDAHTEVIRSMSVDRRKRYNQFEQLVGMMSDPNSLHTTDINGVGAFTVAFHAFKQFETEGSPQRDLRPQEIQWFRHKVDEWNEHKKSKVDSNE